MNVSKRRNVIVIVAVTIGGVLAFGLIFIGWYWWDNTLSHDFRRDAVEATLELNSFGDTTACAGTLYYMLAVQKIDLSVKKAESEVSTKADKTAAYSLRSYYEHLTDREKTCGEHQNDMANMFLKGVLENQLGMNKTGN